MRDFYRADQEDEESFALFANWIEVLLSKIREKFPEQRPFHDKQRLLKHRLFQGGRKSIRDSVKYCHVDTRIEYLSFLKECRKDESKTSKPIYEMGRAKTAAATITPDMTKEFSKQFKYQQQQIGNLQGQMETLLTAFQATHSSHFNQTIPKNNTTGRGSWKGRRNENGRGRFND